jgi:hypothetical protein
VGAIPYNHVDYRFIQRSPHTICHRIVEWKVHPVTRVRTYRTVCGQVLVSNRHECYLLKALDGDDECSYCAAGRPSPGSRLNIRRA